MTLLKKPIKRETPIPADHHGRNIIIEIDPAGFVSFREKGLHKSVTVSVAWLYQKALEAEANRIVRTKKAKRGLLSI